MDDNLEAKGDFEKYEELLELDKNEENIDEIEGTKQIDIDILQVIDEKTVVENLKNDSGEEKTDECDDSNEQTQLLKYRPFSIMRRR